jgi:hypothetical protein
VVCFAAFVTTKCAMAVLAVSGVGHCLPMTAVVASFVSACCELHTHLQH